MCVRAVYGTSSCSCAQMALNIPRCCIPCMLTMLGLAPLPLCCSLLFVCAFAPAPVHACPGAAPRMAGLGSTAHIRVGVFRVVRGCVAIMDTQSGVVRCRTAERSRANCMEAAIIYLGCSGFWFCILCLCMVLCAMCYVLCAMCCVLCAVCCVFYVLRAVCGLLM